MTQTDNFQNSFQQGGNGPYGNGWNANAGQVPGWAGQGGFGYGNQQHGLGQPAFGYNSNFGGGQGWGQGFGQGYGQNFGGQWQQRQLSHQDVGEVVRQILPILPQVIAQAQHQPQAAFGQSGFGGGYGQNFGAQWQQQRPLSQQDVNEVVRQILPVIPQIVGLLQQGQQGGYANAAYGGGQAWNNQGWNNQGQHGQGGFGYVNQHPSQLSLFGQSPFGQNQFGQNQQNANGAYGQAAFGGNQGAGQHRQLNQAEVGEIVRQLTNALPQVIANLQAINQQQSNLQRAA